MAPLQPENCFRKKIIMMFCKLTCVPRIGHRPLGSVATGWKAIAIDTFSTNWNLESSSRSRDVINGTEKMNPTVRKAVFPFSK
jgi:hypothetical protein